MMKIFIEVGVLCSGEDDDLDQLLVISTLMTRSRSSGVLVVAVSISQLLPDTLDAPFNHFNLLEHHDDQEVDEEDDGGEGVSAVAADHGQESKKKVDEEHHAD